MKVSSLLEIDDYSALVRIVTETVETFATLAGNPRPESNGGYFTVMAVETGLPLLIVPIGEMPQEKVQKYFEFSQEKARRLLASQPDGVSSWQTRDPEAGKYAGAIKISMKSGEGDEEKFLILSFSGLPEVGDEAVMLYTAIEGFDFDFRAARQIVEVSGNQLFLPLLAEMKGDMYSLLGLRLEDGESRKGINA